MLTGNEIAAGKLRLTNANKLKASDRETLVSVFRLYLKNRSSAFSDLPVRLAALEDSAETETAAKLAAILIKLEEDGFPEIELSGGRSGLKLNEVEAAVLKVRFALTLLGYDLPEEFSSSLNGGRENVDAFGYFPSVTVGTKPSW